MKVFIVEDSPIVLEVLKRALSSLDGIELCGNANRADTAPKRIAVVQPDIVILDLHLEGGSGLELVGHLRRQPRCPVIAVFSNDAELGGHSVAEGADYFFDKSTGFQQMLATLKILIATKLRVPPVT